MRTKDLGIKQWYLL